MQDNLHLIDTHRVHWCNLCSTGGFKRLLFGKWAVIKQTRWGTSQISVNPAHSTGWHGMRSDLTVMQSQLQSKGLSQLDYFVGTPHDELPQLFSREVTGLCSPDYPRSDDVDRQNQQVSRPLQNYSEQTAFEYKTCLAHT